MDYSLSGLASGFDWKSFINQIMAVQNAPIDRIKAQEQTNLSKNSALTDLQTRITALQTSATALANSTLFAGRQVSSTTPNSTWSAQASGNTASAAYTIAVSQLATTARIDGASDLGHALNSTDDVTGLTVATLPTASAITAGTFTVNGQKITVATTDSLDQVFAAIATATGNTVTASYDHTTDKITLTGAGKIVLGAANDTSNFLTALKLSNNDTTTVSSSGALGVLNPYVTVANARLSSAITAVDPSGNGTFSVNGVSIAYNVNTDTLNDIFSRINQSGAGVTASYDGNTDRIRLTNNVTGDLGVSATEATGGLLDALGLTGGATLVRGDNAQFTINGGATLTSSSNTLTGDSHGITGLSVTVDTVATQTLAVSGNTTAMRAAIQDFITQFNGVESYLANNTAISKSTTGSVTTSILSDNREVQDWGTKLRSMAFSSVAGLSGTINRLENMGIDFTPGTSLLAITDSAKLDTALNNKTSDVAQFFQATTTGLASSLVAYTTTLTTLNGKQQGNLTSTNSDLDRQIADIQRRLDVQRQTLTDSFIAMETAQSQLQSQSAALTNAFGSTSSSTAKSA